MGDFPESENNFKYKLKNENTGSNDSPYSGSGNQYSDNNIYRDGTSSAGQYTGGKSVYDGGTNGNNIYSGSNGSEINDSPYGAGNGSAYPGNSSGNNTYSGNSNGINERFQPGSSGVYPGNSGGNTAYPGNTNGNTIYPGTVNGNTAYPGNTNGNTIYPGNVNGNNPYPGNNLFNDIHSAEQDYSLYSNYYLGPQKPKRKRVNSVFIVVLVITMVIGIFGLRVQKEREKSRAERSGRNENSIDVYKSQERSSRDPYFVDPDDEESSLYQGENDNTYQYKKVEYNGREIFPDVKSAAEYVSYRVDKGDTGRIAFYLDAKCKEDFVNFYDYYHNVKGKLGMDYIWNEIDDKRVKIEIGVFKTDCGYVYRNIVYDEPIPEKMEKAVKLREEVEKVYNECVTEDMSDFEKELALHDRLVCDCKYIGAESVYDDQHTAYGALVTHEAVCDGYAKAMYLLLTRAGIENRVVYGKAGNNGHAWNQVKLDGEWYMLDATWDDLDYGAIEGVAYHKYFNVCDSYIYDSHSWNRDEYYTCNSMEGNYYNFLGYVYSDQTEFKEKISERLQSGEKGVYDCIILDSSNVETSFLANEISGPYNEFYDSLNGFFFMNVIVR